MRPIVIGLTLRRLASKLANSFGIKQTASYLSPRQVGAGIPGGCEAAIHAARRYVEALSGEDVVVKLDFRNAFNSLHRGDMINAAKECIPEVLPYVLSAYAAPTSLHFGSNTIESMEGAQQGDPLGALLFCLAVQPLLESLKSELVFGYLDDVTLAGSQDVIAEDVRYIEAEGSRMGLSLNDAKCEVISLPGTNIREVALMSFQSTSITEATVLGAPLVGGKALGEAWENRCTEMSKAADRLKMIGSQDALTLLRSSIGAPRVQHLMRCSPVTDHPALATFDQIQRSALSVVSNSALSDLHWSQATLPIRDGGLGLRCVTEMAAPAFLSSVSSTTGLQNAMLSKCSLPEDIHIAQVTQKWSSLYGSPPCGRDAFKQAAWVDPISALTKSHITSSLTSTRDRAIFRAAQAPHSGAWLTTLPIAACGLRLEDEAVRVGVALRLGLNLCLPHSCPCGDLVDSYGTHAFVCKHSSGKGARHAAMNDIIARAFNSAQVPVAKETTGLVKGSVQRLDGITLIPWKDGKPVAWDVTVATPLASSYVDGAARNAGFAAELASSRKVTKYAGLPPGTLFQPIALESLSVACSATSAFIEELGRRISGMSGNPAESIHLWQRLSICLVRFNAIMLHLSFIEGEQEPDE